MIMKRYRSELGYDLRNIQYEAHKGMKYLLGCP
jgi:hypothetical protein